MMLIEIIYGSFFVLALFSALMVVLSPHTVHSALYLVLTMLSIAALFVMLNAQLAAVFQVIVYAGAIMVLFLFVIMLLNVGRQETPVRTRRLRWVGLALAAAFVAQMAAVLARPGGQLNVAMLPRANIPVNEVARLLVTNYIYAFEVTSVLLLVGVIGAVSLARRRLVQGPAAPPSREGEGRPWIG